MTKKHQKMQKSTPTFAKKNHQKNAKKMHNMGEMAFSASPPLTHCVVDGHKPPRGTSVRVWLRSVCGGVGGLHSRQGQTNLRERGGGVPHALWYGQAAERQGPHITVAAAAAPVDAVTIPSNQSSDSILLGGFLPGETKQR